MDQRLPKLLRIYQPTEIREILNTGRKYIGNHIILYSLTCLDNHSLTRAGFLSPKRIGNAVKRNQVRRRMREILRKYRNEMINSQRILLMGRTSAIHADFQAIQEDFLRLCRKAKLL